ncbi:exodeoxyribonuclease VII small subunit [Aliidiomarina maris]|uniref:Exodeoxyribonuclease 7 small subunit n=1 Tax=Aliidiomarina maris TaxID=531312 RepID=A0A327WVA9_9GAMM|nr:exodeoxyribonuclease VII small subunit [Aliidiomarina maris]MBA3988288.1 exodeoxyribonuclease VII small subunit [Idiomarina sp.]MCL5049524.1 exodeoxyribonuclease VII small subunit [Bacillota bacterium]RAJ95385.1 exodeoxyribonuclease VII small subunit [Aliidiomarina maris]RUO22724.1 exodeoxyribonuclease VII small subunit [Aliidiomarina maris]
MTESNDTSAALDELSFEQAMSELEHIVGQLEQGDLPLEKSLQQFERAVALSRVSQQKLQQAEQKVSVLLRQGGNDTLQPMSDTENHE